MPIEQPQGCGGKPKALAIGIAPLGIVSIGIVPMGVVSIGVVPMGVLSIGAVGMGVVNVGMTFISLVLVERAGRKTLMVIGLCVMLISTIMLLICLVAAVSSTQNMFIKR